MSKKRIKKKPPERRVIRIGKYLYDVVYANRETVHLGRHGTEKANAEYAKFCSS